MYTEDWNDLIVLASCKYAQSSGQPDVQHREVKFGDVQHGFVRLPFIRDIVGGSRSNDGGMNDFRLECECEARRPGISPPGTHHVSE